MSLQMFPQRTKIAGQSPRSYRGRGARTSGNDLPQSAQRAGQLENGALRYHLLARDLEDTMDDGTRYHDPSLLQYVPDIPRFRL